MLTVYGIRQCDTCRKALKWLEANGVEHRFHDLRADGLDANLVRNWMDSGFAGMLVNRRSTTWRGLAERERAVAGDDLLRLLLDHPTLIKRPVFVSERIIGVGFNPADLQEVLGG